MSVKKNLLKNGVATGVQKAIRIAEQLLLVPFFISAWGAEYYGEWLTLTIIPSMLAFSDLGFGTSAANRFLLKYAAGDYKGAGDTARSGLFIINLVVVGSMLLSVLIVLGLDQFDVFSKSLIDRNDAIIAVSILMLSKILNFYQQLFESFYRAKRKAAYSMNLISIYSSSIIITGLLVLTLGYGVIEFAIANLVVSVIFNPLYSINAVRVLALPKEHKGSVLKSEIKDIANKGFGYLLSPIWQAIYFQGSTFVVRMTLGPLAVTIFNTVRTVSRTVNQVFNLVTLSVFPELQFEIGAKNLDKARKLYRFTFGIVTASAVAGILFLYVFGPQLYELWTQKALNPPPLMWNIFLIGIAFNAFWWSGTIIFQAYNKPYYFTVSGVIAASISVVASYFLAIKYGLSGAALGAILLDVMLAFYILPASCKLIGQSFLKLFPALIADSKVMLQKLKTNS